MTVDSVSLWSDAVHWSVDVQFNCSKARDSGPAKVAFQWAWKLSLKRIVCRVLYLSSWNACLVTLCRIIFNCRRISRCTTAGTTKQSRGSMLPIGDRVGNFYCRLNGEIERGGRRYPSWKESGITINRRLRKSTAMCSIYGIVFWQKFPRGFYVVGVTWRPI